MKTWTQNAPQATEQEGAAALHGLLSAIWIKTAHWQPMESRSHARLLAGRGLQGNAHQGGKRQITLLDATRWAAACAELGVEVDPIQRRANLYICHLDLEFTFGRILEIGGCRIRIRGETKPCGRMDKAHPGLRAALEPDWRGGIYGDALDDGEIQVGAPVRWL